VNYVYLLKSNRCADRRYVGVTAELRQRLADHNSGKSHRTAQYMPWQLATYIAFSEKPSAYKFERYFKSGSGHAFAKRHLG